MAQINIVVYFRRTSGSCYFYVPVDPNLPIRVPVGRGVDPRTAIAVWLKSQRLPEALSMKRIAVKNADAWLCELPRAIQDIPVRYAPKSAWVLRKEIVHSPVYSDLLSVFIQIAHDNIMTTQRRPMET